MPPFVCQILVVNVQYLRFVTQSFNLYVLSLYFHIAKAIKTILSNFCCFLQSVSKLTHLGFLGRLLFGVPSVKKVNQKIKRVIA